MIRERRQTQPPRQNDEQLAEQLQALQTPLQDKADLDSLLEAIGTARFVLLGEASHGTSEYYRWRAWLSQRLIEEQGFSFIAVEGDWPASPNSIHRWVASIWRVCKPVPSLTSHWANCTGRPALAPRPHHRWRNWKPLVSLTKNPLVNWPTRSSSIGTPAPMKPPMGNRLWLPLSTPSPGVRSASPSPRRSAAHLTFGPSGRSIWNVEFVGFGVTQKTRRLLRGRQVKLGGAVTGVAFSGRYNAVIETQCDGDDTRHEAC